MKSYIIDCPVGNTLEFSNNLENQNNKHTASHINTDNNTSSIPKNDLPEESYALFDSIRPTKKRKGTSYTPVIFAHIEVGNKIIPAKVLLDSGTSDTIISGHLIPKVRRRRKSKATKWDTRGGNFTTSAKANVKFKMPELDKSKNVTWSMHVDDTPNTSKRYDMILGRDLLQELSLDILFSECEIRGGENGPYQDCSCEMKDYSEIAEQENNMTTYDNERYDSSIAKEASDRATRITAADYKKADLEKVVADCKHLNKNEKKSLYKLLKRYEFLFDGTLGTWHSKPVDIELKEGATPYYARPFPAPRAHEKVFREEIERLVKIGVLRRCNNSEWGAPCFIQAKKNGTVRFLTDFRELNKRIKRKPYPIPNIQDMLLKLDRFQWATSLDLNMGYYHVLLSPSARQLCTIVLPWGKYEYCRLPMGVSCAPDIFQEKINELFHGMDHIHAYLDDVLLTTKNTWEDHLKTLEDTLQKLAEAGLKVNVEKSFFGQAECEYLGYWVTREGIRPQAKKVEAIEKIEAPKTVRQIRRFVGLCNYYRDLWPRRAETLAPLTRLCSKNKKFVWTETEQKAFETMKSIIGKDILLAYPNFSQSFDIHTDASKTQLGAVISQNGRPIAFYSRKLSDAQTRYTTTERELLSIVETLKEFRNILLGQRIKVYTDHKNLTYKQFTTDRVMRWRLILEEYGPELVYIKGRDNVAANALSRLDLGKKLAKLPTTNDPENFREGDVTTETLAERYDTGRLSSLDAEMMPLTYEIFEKYQTKDTQIQNELNTGKLTKRIFRGADGDIMLATTDKGKIYVPRSLRKQVLEWYHTYLMHPGASRTEETIKQHLYWPGLQENCKALTRTCLTCQLSKKQQRKYGHLPAKTAETKPWEILCVDLIGPYRIRRKGKKNSDLELKAVTMIDPATGWFEICTYDDKRAITVANLVELTWLSRYPRPSKVTMDRGKEFVGKEFKRELCEKEYGIKVKMATTANPQANSIVERVHQTLGNMVRSLNLQESEDLDFEWNGVLSAAAYGIRSTYHTTLKASPGQLVFGRDMIFNIRHVADWRAIQQRKQQVIDKNNRRENSTRIEHHYQIGDEVIMRNKSANKYEPPNIGPFEIVRVHNNGTVTLKKGAIEMQVNIRHLSPLRK